MDALTKVIRDYYLERGLTWPTSTEAMGFLATEQGEVWELLLSRKSGWVRNNPQNKPQWSPEKFSEELGDVIMMAIVAGLVEGVDPVQSLVDKVERKLAALKNNPLLTQ